MVQTDYHAENRKRKNTLSFFFPKPLVTPFFLCLRKWSWDFPIVFVLKYKNTTVPIRTRCLCLLYRGKGHVHIIKSTGSRLGKRLLSKGISQKPFLTDDLPGDRYKKNLLHTVATRYPCVLLLCVRWFSIRDLRFDTSDRSYCWCCVIHRRWLSSRAPTPSVISSERNSNKIDPLWSLPVFTSVILSL